MKPLTTHPLQKRKIIPIKMIVAESFPEKMIKELLPGFHTRQDKDPYTLGGHWPYIEIPSYLLDLRVTALTRKGLPLNLYKL